MERPAHAGLRHPAMNVSDLAAGEIANG